MSRRPVILFDGVCNLCNRWVRFVVKRDPEARFAFAPLQSETGQRLLRERGLSTESMESVVLIDGAVTLTGSDAALQVLGNLKRPWPLLTAGRYMPRVLRDWVYDLVARNRYSWFGRRDACMIPTDDLAARFLDQRTKKADE